MRTERGIAGAHVALLRGINVGKAKRVAMADLRALVAGLGYRDVRTLLNSGNVVFTVPRGARGDPAARIEQAIAKKIGVSSRVTVLTAAELATVVRENPLGKVAKDPSRLLVTVLTNPKDRAKLAPLAKQDWAPEALAIGKRVAYLWCPRGQLESPVAKAVFQLLGDAVTTRNWATITKLHVLSGEAPEGP
jgi:uncharacterized protein (DUF1697 family)